tara:strand:- start:7283 stop:9322 length:2040 start_codon:yes stop_codon:yes gene_type:complete
MALTVAQLEDAITTLDTLFEEGQDCIWDGKLYTDGEYDALRKQLAKLAPNSSALSRVTASTVQSGFKKVQHHPPMCSLNKINGTQAEKESELAAWLKECRDELGDDAKFTKAFKLDGVALRAYYKDGKFVKAGLRPNDGVTADDVTANCAFVDGIPKELKEPITCSISGEIVCFLSDFKKINADLEAKGEKLRANPRNHAAGSIRQLDAAKTKAGKLRFIAYSVENYEGTAPYKDEAQRAKWVNQRLGKIRFVRVTPFDGELDDLQEMEDLVSKLDYEVDGVVLSVRDLEEQEQCGKHGSSVTANPRGKIAWKFKEKSADVVVKGWIEQVGRTGRIVPVLQFDAVNLAGTQVRQATGHNIGFMERKKITRGTIVRIIKSGKIIPKVIGVVKDQGKPVFLTHCPCCSSRLEVVEGGMVDGVANRDLYCQSDTCPAKNVGTLAHYLSTFGVKGLGDSTIEELVNNGLVSSPADFYTLEVDDVVQKSGLSERQATLAIAGIHMIPNPSAVKDNAKLLVKVEKAKGKKKTILASRFFACLGIAGAGKGTGKALVEHFGSFDKIRTASVAELEAVPDVGETTAQVVNDWFKAVDHLVDNLLEHVELELPKTGPLSGKSFCFSGGFEGGKRKWEEAVEEQGGTIKSSVGRSTSFLVEGENAGSKVAKATGYGVTILSIDDLEKML